MFIEDFNERQKSIAFIKRVAGMSVMECFGVVGMANIKGPDGIVRILESDEAVKGVKVAMLPEDKVIIDVYVVMEFGVKAEAVAENLIDTIKYNVEKQTGVKVKKITVNVQSVRV